MTTKVLAYILMDGEILAKKSTFHLITAKMCALLFRFFHSVKIKKKKPTKKPNNLSVVKIILNCSSAQHENYLQCYKNV